jgi:hypothetical protein
VVVEHVLEIDAPPQRVWKVVCDLDRYPEWNPFVVACRSSLAVGDPIEMRVHVFRSFAQPQRETIFEHVPGRRLCYGVPGQALGALASRRCHELEPLGARTRYVSHFELSGWLAPVVRLLLGRRLEAGFAAMSAALKARAEAPGASG